MKQLLAYILLPCLLFGSEGNYALSTGLEDKERLFILNEIYTPHTIEFLTCGIVEEGDAVLDVGCGIGLVSQELARLVGKEGRVVAIDSSEEQISIARSLVPEDVTFRQLSAYDLETIDEKFDLVYFRFVLCHLKDPDQVLQQIKKVLKPGGRVVIEDLTGNETLYTEPHSEGLDVHRYFDQLQFELQQSDDKFFLQIPKKLQEAGFLIAKSTTSHPELDTLRKRKMLTYDLSSLKKSLIESGKLTAQEYEAYYRIVEDLVNDLSIRVFSYQLGHLMATYENER